MPTIKKQTPTVRRAPANDFLSSIGPISELPETGVKLLITGPTATGKTTLGCSAPKPLCLLRPEAVEDGSKSVRTVPGIDSPRPLGSANELDLFSEYQGNERKYKTVFLDGVQFFQDLVLKKVLSLGEVPAQLSWGIAKQSDWGAVGNELKEHLRKFLKLAEDGTHVIISGGERTINEGGDSDIVKPSLVVALTPSSAGWLNFCCDYIVSTFIRHKTTQKEVQVGTKKVQMSERSGGIEYCIRTMPDGVYEAKFRVPKGTLLPPVVVDPTFPKIQDLIAGRYKPDARVK